MDIDVNAHSSSELERLSALHKAGELTDQEFADAKAKLLGRHGKKWWPWVFGIIVVVVGSYFLIHIISDRMETNRIEQARADSTRVADSLMKPRIAIWGEAVKLIREHLKAPSTAHFAMLGIHNSDSEAVFSSDKFAIARGEYDAQNGFGTYLHDIFEVRLTKNPDGSGWSKMYGDLGEAYGVNMSVEPSYSGHVQDDASWITNASGNVPPPPPPPVFR